MSSLSPAMISTKALGAMPAFAVSELGEKKAFHLLSAAGLSDRYLSEKEGYIPENALCEFVAGVGRELGEDNLGLLFAPFLTVADYGVWGDFVLSAPDLGTALLRAQKLMHLHSSTDRVEFLVLGGAVSYSYEFGLKSHDSYPDIAASAVAAMLSIPKHYLGQIWCPSHIEFDFPSGQNCTIAEETFGCPVSFDGSRLRLVFDATCLSTPLPSHHVSRPTTPGDILRERSRPPATLINSISTVVDQHVADGNASLDRLAHTIGVGPRRLQRHLRKCGTNFRAVLTKSRMERAVELLVLKGSSVQNVSEALGYGEPGNFTRAFTQRFGVSPSRYVSARKSPISGASQSFTQNREE